MTLAMHGHPNIGIFCGFASVVLATWVMRRVDESDGAARGEPKQCPGSMEDGPRTVRYCQLLHPHEGLEHVFGGEADERKKLADTVWQLQWRLFKRGGW